VRIVGLLDPILQVPLEWIGFRLRIAEIQPERVYVRDGMQKRDRLCLVLVGVLVSQSGERELFKLSGFLESVLSRVVCGAKRTILVEMKQRRAWREAKDVYIDPANGDDRNDGLDEATPIKTMDEARRRWGGSDQGYAPPFKTCFRAPHSNLEPHVAEDGSDWKACPAMRRVAIEDSSSVQINGCSLPDRHATDHEDREGVRWINDPYWEIVETKDLRMGDVIRSTDFGEPLAVFSASEWTVRSDGISCNAPHFYRLKIRGYRFGYLDREPSRDEIIQALTPVHFRDLWILFRNWVRGAKK